MTPKDRAAPAKPPKTMPPVLPEAHPPTCTAFEGSRRIATGQASAVALAVKAVQERGASGPVLVFDDLTSVLVEFDLRGTDADVLARLPSPAPAALPAADSGDEADSPRGPGRPRLGVVAREVTLLPRHWDWLGSQRGGASVALRQLVEEARRAGAGKERQRMAQEAAYRFMAAMAGNEPGFEEATRALFASARDRFAELIGSWPQDVREHAHGLAASAFAATDAVK